MTGSVTYRDFDNPQSSCMPYTDSPSTFDLAEKIAGKRLDRRKSYCVSSHNELMELVKWTQCCSGCSDGSEYSTQERGMGCYECGYKGRVRNAMWVPLIARPTDLGD